MPTTFAQRISGLTGSVARDILSRSQNSSIVSFAGGLPDASLWTDLELPQIPPDAFQYGPSEGDLALRKLISTQASTIGLNASPTNSLITTGSQQGLDLAAKLLLDPRSPVVTETPTYLAAIQVFHLFQAKLHALPLDAEGLDPNALDSSLSSHQPRLVYLNPSYQNPTGICYSRARREAIAAVLDRHETILLEDEPYRELAFAAPTPPAISSFLKCSPWIHLSSVSKTLIPSLRLGSLTCSQELFPNLLKLKQAADLHSSRISQSIAVQLLSDQTAHANRLAKTIARYREKRDAMQVVLAKHFSDLADWHIPAGGMFFWLSLRQPIDLPAALETALTQGFAFMPGHPFHVEPNQAPPSIRLNFTQPSLKSIETHLPKLAEIIRHAPPPRRSQPA